MCIGTVNMFASGIGGGGFAVVRTANGESRSFNFREMAPKAAYQDMYHGNTLPLMELLYKVLLTLANRQRITSPDRWASYRNPR